MTTNTPTLPGLDVQTDTTNAPILSPAERRALTAVDAFIAANGYAPTTRDLGDALGCWPSYAGRLLDALAAKSAIRRAPGRARGLVVLTADVA